MAIIKGINVGTTQITSSYTNGSTLNDSKELSVVAVSFEDVNGAIAKPGDTTYTGSAITPTPNVTVVLDGQTETLTLGTDYTLSYSNNINTGTATVTATGKGNYSGTLSENWTILGATITVQVENQEYEYDGNLHGSGITAITVNNQEATIRYRTTSSGEYNLTSAPQIRNVGEISYGIVYFRVTAPNHTVYEGTYTLTITPLVATLSWGTTSWMYDGNEHSTTCVVTNLVSGDTCTVTLTGNSITNIAQSPVTVTATGLSNSNYTLTGASNTSVQLTLNPGLFVKISGEWTPVKQVYRRESGNWVKKEYADWNGTVFKTGERYVKKN